MRCPEPQASLTGPRLCRPAIWTGGLLCALLAGHLALQVEPARAAESSGDAEAVLLAVRLDGTTLSDGLPCTLERGSVRVPLGALCTLLDLAIHVDTARGVAEGFFLSEDRRFALRLAQHTVRVEKRDLSFDSTLVEMRDGDFYVDASLLASWLPLNVDTDPFGALLNVRPREPLPIEVRRERRLEVERNLRQLGLGGPSYPEHSTPYRLLGLPFVDQSLALHLGSAGHPAGSAQVEGSTYLTMSLLFAEAGAYFTRKGGGGSSMRLHASRRTPGGESLGPLPIREITVGDISYPGLDLITRSVSGPGILITNRPPGQPTQFDHHTFTGELPPGWDVELYRNGALLAYQDADPSGRYAFNEIPLLFGPNAFRLEFHGPQGQQRQDLQTFNVGLDLTPPGALYYRLAVSDLGNAVRERSLLEWNIGLTRQVSAAVSFAGAPHDLRRQHYGLATARGFYGGLLGSLSVAMAQDSGSLVRASLQTRVGPVGLDLRQARLERFNTEALGASGGTGNLSSVRVDAVPKFAPGLAFPVVIEVDRARMHRGSTLDQLGTSLGWSRRGFSITAHNQWARTINAPAEPRVESRGDVFLARQTGRIGIRSQIGYTLRPQGNLSTVALSTDFRLRGDARMGVGINHSATQDRYTMTLERGSGPFGYGLHASYAANAGLAASLTFSAGLASEPRTGRWYASARPVAGYGAASAQVFLDANGNGVMDPGEEPLPGVGLRTDPPTGVGQTNAEGVAFLDHLAGDGSMNLTLSPGTLENPQWVAERSGVRLTPRIGVTSMVDFPVALSGEVTGTIRQSFGSQLRGVGGVELMLRDAAADTVIRRAVTDYDGFYDFAELRPGRYELAFSGGQCFRMNVGLPPARAVTIGPDGTVLDAVDYLLRTEAQSEASGRVALAAHTEPPRADSSFVAALPEPVAPVAVGTAVGAPALSVRRGHAQASHAGPRKPPVVTRHLRAVHRKAGGAHRKAHHVRSAAHHGHSSAHHAHSSAHHAHSSAHHVHSSAHHAHSSTHHGHSRAHRGHSSHHGLPKARHGHGHAH